jgi:hypothetical protein
MAVGVLAALDTYERGLRGLLGGDIYIKRGSEHEAFSLATSEAAEKFDERDEEMSWVWMSAKLFLARPIIRDTEQPDGLSGPEREAMERAIAAAPVPSNHHRNGFRMGWRAARAYSEAEIREAGEERDGANDAARRCSRLYQSRQEDFEREAQRADNAEEHFEAMMLGYEARIENLVEELRIARFDADVPLKELREENERLIAMMESHEGCCQQSRVLRETLAELVAFKISK